MQYPTELDHPRFKVIIRPGSDRLTIFFAGTGTADHRFHFYGQAQRCESNVILVNNGGNRWYQDGVPGLGDGLTQTIETIKAWSKALNAPKIYCVGASMGGSGAVLFGSLLQCSVLAFGFEARLLAPYSNSWRLLEKGFELAYPDLTPLIEQCHATFKVLLGSESWQDLHASLHLGNLPNVDLAVMANVRHGPPLYLKRAGRLDGVIDAFLRDENLTAISERTAVPPGFAAALYEAAQGYWTSDLARWRRGGEQAVTLWPASPIANHFLGRAILKAGDVDAALPHLEIGALNGGKDGLYYRAYALRHAGRIDEAIARHRETIASWPEHPNSYLDLAIAYQAGNRHQEAAAALRELLVIEPDQPKALERLKTIEKRFGLHKRL